MRKEGGRRKFECTFALLPNQSNISSQINERRLRKFVAQFFSLKVPKKALCLRRYLVMWHFSSLLLLFFLPDSLGSSLGKGLGCWRHLVFESGHLLRRLSPYTRGQHVPYFFLEEEGPGGDIPFSLCLRSQPFHVPTLWRLESQALSSKRRCNDFPKCLYEHWPLASQNKTQPSSA